VATQAVLSGGVGAMNKLFFLLMLLFGAASASAEGGSPTDVKKPATEAALEGDEYLFNGLSFTPFRLDAKVAGFDIEVETSVVREARLALPTATPLNPSGPYPALSAKRPARLTDMRISLRRSFPISKKLLVDTLVRAEIPTGDVHNGLGNGRQEIMADLGIRAELKSFSLWAGGARRFNKQTYWSTGRDVNEVYAGWNKRLSSTADLRMDFVKTGRRYLNEPREWRLSTEYSKTTASGSLMTLYAAREVGYWGKDMRVGVQFSVPLGRRA
jgi:hypothetical protein